MSEGIDILDLIDGLGETFHHPDQLVHLTIWTECDSIGDGV